jgi:hypothetical protein
LAAAGGEDVAAGVLAVTGAGGGCVDWGDGGDEGGEGGVAAAGALPAPGTLVALFAPCTADVALSGLAAVAADFAVGAAVVAGAAAGAAAGALVAAAGAVAA